MYRLGDGTQKETQELLLCCIFPLDSPQASWNDHLLVIHSSFSPICLSKARSQDQVPDRLHAEHGTEEEAVGRVPRLAQ